jgi:uncharacterized Zn-binding protein involved in type VI secretion
MGQPVTRKGDKSTGHGPYKPRASTGASPDVFVNGIAVNREGDTWAPHTPPPNDVHAGQVHTTTSGSATVKANGKQLTRIGDPVEGDTSGAGSSNVFAGG